MIKGAILSITKLKAIMFSESFSWSVVVGAVSSPLWMDVILATSNFSTLMLPILGFAIAFVTLVSKLRSLIIFFAALVARHREPPTTE